LRKKSGRADAAVLANILRTGAHLHRTLPAPQRGVTDPSAASTQGEESADDG
jgi:hypothetical protein